MSRYDYQVRLDGAIEAVKIFMRAADNVTAAEYEDEIDVTIGRVYQAAENAAIMLKELKEKSNEF